MKKILIISSSLRKGGNSDTLADSFAQGAKDAGQQVEKISLSAKSIHFCQGCMSCHKTFHCVQKDDASLIVEQMKTADVIVFATPIYYYSLCGQLKTLLDRSNPLYLSDYAFRDIYLLASATDSNPSAIDGAITTIQGWISCFEKVSLKGVVRGVGVREKGEVKTHSDLLNQAYTLGKQA